jgi:hypothetical protein
MSSCRHLPAVLVTVLTAAILSAAEAASITFFDAGRVTVCPGSAGDIAPPDFSGPGCETGPAGLVDPQGRVIWVRATVSLESTEGPSGEPFSLFVSGKMASEVWLNGRFIGANGKPGSDRASEVPGLMDAELHPDQTLFRLGENEIILRASAHHGFLRLSHPFHTIAIAEAGSGWRERVPQISLSLMTLGGLLLGGVYFAVSAVLTSPRGRALIASGICFAAAAQLLAEALRGLWSYPYPAHEWRLVAIAFFAWCFGMLASLHVLRILGLERSGRITGTLGGITLLAMIIAEGFDLKALLAMGVPLGGTALLSAFWALRGRERAWRYAASLAVFITALIFLGGLFLDLVFYLLVAAFVAFLLVDQAILLSRETKERRLEEDRANRLSQALAEAEERHTEQYLSIRSSGKTERVAASRIVALNAADGYAEILLADGRALLHAAPLAEMEEALPATFLRVHRSHVVNVTFVDSLTRDPSGTGNLKMTTGTAIPVSRRIMPKVRKALA